MFSSKELAIPDFSSITPININNGTAINVSLVTNPKILFGNTLIKTRGNMSKRKPTIPTKIAVPANVKATG